MWMTLSKKESERIFNDWEETVSTPDNIHHAFIDLRKDLFNCFQETLEVLQIQQIKGKEYEVDLEFGIRMYILLVNKYKFNERHASDDGIWRYLSLKIVPDITFKRWGLNPQRFYFESRRLWIKSLWWYIHLSWQDDYDKTLNVLKDNTTDELVQLVERSGPSGYRVQLCRKIMYHYSSLSSEKKKRGSQIFRRIMKLNTARSKVVEPSLVIGGEEKYVKELFEYFGQNVNTIT
jgi:hypothetical protein